VCNLEFVCIKISLRLSLGFKKQECRKRNIDLHNNYSVSSAVRITKARNFRWAGYAECMGKKNFVSG
jgi:hypothetical protein